MHVCRKRELAKVGHFHQMNYLTAYVYNKAHPCQHRGRRGLGGGEIPAKRDELSTSTIIWKREGRKIKSM